MENEPQPVPTPVVSSMRTEPQPPNRGPVLMLLLLIAILLAGGGYYLGTMNSQTVLPVPSPMVYSSPVIPADEMVGWKTYINYTQGFSIKYPADYFKFQQEYPDVGLYLAPSQGEGGNGPKFLKPGDVWIDVTTSSAANIQSLDEYLNLPGQKPFPANATKTPITIDGIGGYVIEYSSPAVAGDVTTYSNAGIVLNNEKIYMIVQSAWNEEILQANRKMFDQILSTFKFMGQLHPVTGDNNPEFVVGDVLVMFNNGTTYKQAKDLFQKLGIINFDNSYWKAENKTPTDDTILATIDLFTVKVTPGTEDTIIQQLSQEPIVRAAIKNGIGHTQ